MVPGSPHHRLKQPTSPLDPQDMTTNVRRVVKRRKITIGYGTKKCSLVTEVQGFEIPGISNYPHEDNPVDCDVRQSEVTRDDSTENSE